MARIRQWTRVKLVAIVLVLLGGTLSSVSEASAKPNILLIMTDDMSHRFVQYMPKVHELIINKGATFEAAYYNIPLCCPSRATILTGLYSQNAVQSNSHQEFYREGLPNRIYPIWLQKVGYRTAVIGKYLNGFPFPASAASYNPPGWNYMAVRVGASKKDAEDTLYYNYKIKEGRSVLSFGATERDYSTDVYTDRAVKFIQSVAGSGQPFAMWLSYMGPHAPTTPAPRHQALFPDLRAPTADELPSINEADVSDKPAYMRARAPTDQALLDKRYRDQARTLQSVDEGVKKVLDAVQAAGQLENTYVVFTSDNGWLLGEHRLPGGKGYPYEEATKMLLYVRGPDIAPGTRVRHLVGNVDLAGTFAEWAGATVASSIDGRSFAPLLASSAPAPAQWRKAYPLFFKEGTGPKVPGWRGVRTEDYAYYEYVSTGEKELYDMRSDPHQLKNVANTADPALVQKLGKLALDLSRCKGQGCRELENKAVTP